MMAKIVFFIGIAVFSFYTTETSSEEVILSTIVGDSGGGQHSLDASDGSPANAVYVDNAGYVGIGMTSPGTKLHLYNDTANMEVSLDAPANNTYASAVVHKRGGLKRWWVGSNNNAGADDYTWYRYDNSGNPLSPVTAMTILRASGNVGIGIAQPTSNLHVYSSTSDVVITAQSQLSTGKAQLVASSGGDKTSGLLVMQNGSNVVYFGSVPDGAVDWGIYDYGLSKWVMQSDVGRILFGTGNGYPTPSDAYVSVLGDGSADSFAVYDQGPSIDFIVKGNGRVGIGKSNPDHPLHMASGAYVSVAGAWVSASSLEGKQNVMPLELEQAQQTVMSLNPVEYDSRLNPQEHHVGFIAEEVPGLVATADRKGLSSMDIVAVVTRVVQDQQRRIEELEKELAEIRKEK